jgi:hypothetical protein
VFAAFAGFGIRSPAVGPQGQRGTFRSSAGVDGSSSGSKQQQMRSQGGSPVVKPLMLEMDGFRYVLYSAVGCSADWSYGTLQCELGLSAAVCCMLQHQSAYLGCLATGLCQQLQWDSVHGDRCTRQAVTEAEHWLFNLLFNC